MKSIDEKMKLIILDDSHKKALFEMMEEWEKYNRTHIDANKSPSFIFKEDYRDFKKYLDSINADEPEEGFVRETNYFLYDEEEDKMIGAISLRHELNDFLLKYGGHVGYGIRPSMRGCGYGSHMLKLLLEKAREMGFKKLLIICNKDNIGSKKIIENNGGVLYNRVNKDGVEMLRYWIDLDK